MGNLLSEKEVAVILGIKPQTLSIWRMKKEKLPFVRIGRRVAYRREDIEEWLKAQTVSIGGGR